jgi:hypothetical protein
LIVVRTESALSDKEAVKTTILARKKVAFFIEDFLQSITRGISIQEQLSCHPESEGELHGSRNLKA